MPNFTNVSNDMADTLGDTQATARGKAMKELSMA